VRNELWATCVGAFGYCAPFVIDVFDLNTFTRDPALSADSKFYYQPLGSLNKILVINAATLAVVKQITVGINPRRVYIQGDTGPHER
jgi:YVTN family beta-propeller protein